MVVLQVRVVDEGSGVVQQGSTPLVVSGFFGLSNPINSTVVSIRVPEDLVCTIRLMAAETQFPMAGRLVREEDSVLRRGSANLNRPSVFLTFILLTCQI